MLPERPFVGSLLAVGIRAATLLVIVELAGAPDLFGHLRPAWIWLVAAAELLTFPAYAVVYRSIARLGRPVKLGAPTLARIVVAGFGPLNLSGGFGVDKSALQALGEDRASAEGRIGALATVEWLVLAPCTCVVSIVLLASGASISGSLVWPWAVGIPLGVVAASWATVPQRVQRFRSPGGRAGKFLANRLGRKVAAILAHTVDGIIAVKTMARRPDRYAGVWVGTALYWSLEICALYGALRAAGLRLGVGTSILAYATGYLASRRSLPLGGAGLAEALLIYSLYDLHEPVGPSIVAVLVYRAFNFLLVLVPALFAYHGLRPAFLGADGPDPGA